MYVSPAPYTTSYVDTSIHELYTWKVRAPIIKIPVKSLRASKHRTAANKSGYG